MSVWQDRLDGLGVTHHWNLNGGSLTARVGGLNLTSVGAGVTVNQPGLLPWESGEGAIFDGAVAGRLEAPVNAALKPTGEFSVGCIIKPGAYTADYQSILRQTSSGFYMLSTTGRAFGGGLVTNLGVYSPAGSVDALLVGNTYLVGMTLERPVGSAGRLVCYIDGKESSSIAVPEAAVIQYDIQTMRWGEQSTSVQHYRGSLDEPFFFNNKALTEEEWNDLYDAYVKAPRVPFKKGFNRLVIDTIHPLDATVEQSALREDFIILQSWDTALRDRIKAANPACKVLAYRNFGSFNTTRHVSGLSSSLVNYDEAAPGQPVSPAGAQAGAHPTWFLHSTATGLPFTFSSYAYLYAVNPADAGLRAQMATNALALDSGWDGIFADDINGTMQYYHSVADVTELPTDVLYGEAMIGLLKVVRDATLSQGKLLIANLGAWSGYAYWGKQALEHLDGGFDEFRGKFDTSTNSEGTYRYWSDGWMAEQKNQAYCEYIGRLYLSSTASIAGDVRAATYGYASVLLTSEGRSYNGLHHNYGTHDWFDVYDIPLGEPIDPPVALTTDPHVFVRRFEDAIVLVNPTDTDGLTASFAGIYNGPDGLTDTMTLDSHTAMILPRVSSFSASNATIVSSELNEEFDSGWNIWKNYDAYDPALRATLHKQRHIDIRNFRTDDIVAPINVLELSRFKVSFLTGQSVSQVEGLSHAIKSGEHWSAGINIIPPDRNYWKLLSLPVTVGTNDTTSVLPPINLLDGFEDDDFISLALPDFPLANVTQSTSFVQFTSDPDGNFTTGPTASVSLSSSTLPLIAGDSQFRVPRSTFDQNDIDLGAITAVRLRILATDSATVKFAGLRLLSKDWKFGNVDVDTRFDTLIRPVSPNADPAYPIEFSQPIVWHAAEVPGEQDPRPIDFNLAVGFNTGSRQGSNQISIYGRELTEDFMQMLDINGLSQGQLTNHEQPDLGDAMYNPREQTDLEPFGQDQLDDLTQYNLERTPDYLSASWVEFVLQWTADTTTLSVVNTESSGYTFTLDGPLDADANYVLVLDLKDTSARAAIYPLGARGEIIFYAPIFDSTVIDDDFIYKRRKGRFGWFSQLADGDASVDSIRFRSSSYAEYRSLPYESLTPVIGAELSAESSPVIELFDDFYPTDASITVGRDRELSTTGSSYRVTDYGDFTYQGLESNPFQITDFDQIEILLDVYYPSSVDATASLEFFLRSSTGYMIQLPEPRIYSDQWQTIRLRAPTTHLAQTGIYNLVIVQSHPYNINWWVDKVQVFERSVSWHGRAVVEDPWAATEDDWTPFQNSFNRDFGGILFQGREDKMQVKAVGHKQESTIGKVQFKPRYAELGRFVWPEDELVGLEEPEASYSTDNIDRLYTFDGFGSTDPDGAIINWYWTVSDGTGTVLVGPIVQHEFAEPGTYSVTLTVTDQNGLINTTSALHSVA